MPLWTPHKDSKAQLEQDLFVLWALNNRKNGFYVEFGATNGVSLSNTWYLEKAFGWRGILAEPAITWQSALKLNRGANNRIELDCVWSKTGETFEFHEVGVYSTLRSFSDTDSHAEVRNKSKSVYTVKTISLMDMLEKHNAPNHIDYLSIDTEGSELEILQSLDFKKYKVDVITCEHNFTDMRDKIYQLLSSNGYKRVCEDLSKWDDWYVLEALEEK